MVSKTFCKDWKDINQNGKPGKVEVKERICWASSLSGFFI